VRLPSKVMGGFVSSNQFNALVDAVHEFSRFSVGPGLEMRETAAGRALSLSSASGDDCDTVSTLPLNSEVGMDMSDSWMQSNAHFGVSIKVPALMTYDTSSGSFKVYRRTWTFDACGNLKSIGAINAGEIVFTADACP
jgi:hypothetical protein